MKRVAIEFVSILNIKVNNVTLAYMARGRLLGKIAHFHFEITHLFSSKDLGFEDD